MTQIYLNDRLVDAAEARIDPSDRGFSLGDGLFETMRAAGGKPLRLAAHLKRLRDGAKVLDLTIPLDDKALAAALEQVLTANSLSDGVLRLTVTRGPGPRGLLPPQPATPTVMVSAGPLPPALGPARAIIATTTRRNEHSPLSRIKNLNYGDNILARLEAARKGADDALLLNSAGRLTESTIANLFLVIDGDTVTPSPKDGCLPGVMRADIMDRLGAGIAKLGPEDLWMASEAFLTNSLGVRPLIEVDGRPIGNGEVGPTTQRVMAQVN